MRFSQVYLEAIGYELAPVVVSTAELEARLAPVYQKLHVPQGQLEFITGISERRWWGRDYPISQGAACAARKALAASNLTAKDLDILIYAGVCREQFEPATACRVGAEIGINPDATVYDISNACLGVLNGIVEVANRIELGQCRAGLVVSCETAREINEAMIERMMQTQSMEVFKNAPQHHGLCRWGWETLIPSMIEKITQTQAGSLIRTAYNLGIKHCVMPFMSTDAVSVLKFGVDLGMRTWKSFLTKVNWGVDQLDKVICHQVGSSHQEAMLKMLGVPIEKDFSTYQYLGNIGTVSLPLTAALAEEREFLKPGDRVGFLGIGSGLNCMMLGVEW